MLSADVTAPVDANLNTVVPLYLNKRSLSPVSSIMLHLLEPNNIELPFVSKLPPNWGVVSLIKSVGTRETLAFPPVPSAKIILLAPFAIATVVPLPPPCLIVAVWPVLFLKIYHFCWSLGSIVTLNAPLGVPVNIITLYWPLDNVPSLVVNVTAPLTVKVKTPFKALSIILKFVLVVVPHVLIVLQLQFF